MNINLNKEKHIYTVDGSVYPSVTTVLKSVGYVNLDRIPHQILEYKRELGTNVHLATQYCDEKILDEVTIGEAEKPYFEGYTKFLLENQPEILGIEQHLVSKKFRFAGTPDRIVIITGDKGVLEIKCTAEIMPAARVQTMAYKMAYNEMNPKEKAKNRWILHLKGNGEYNLVPCSKDNEDKIAFLNALGAHNWKERYL